MLKKISLTNLLTEENFRTALINTSIVTSVFYFGSINSSMLSIDNVASIFDNYVIVKFLGIGLIVKLVFYNFILFLLRWFYQGYIKDKYISYKKRIVRAGYAKAKDSYIIYSTIKSFFSKYIVRLGLVSKKELAVDFNISMEDREQIINMILPDLYKWMCALIHYAFNLFFIWRYLNIFIIISLLFLFFIFSILPIGLMVIIFNIELMNKIGKTAFRVNSL